MPNLLFEIGCEELPASACREAGAQLRERWLPELGAGRVYVGPRRLAIFVEEVPDREPGPWRNQKPARHRGAMQHHEDRPAENRTSHSTGS